MGDNGRRWSCGLQRYLPDHRLAADGELLFVANANNNNIAVFDVETVGKAKSLGFIPVGWFPTSVRVTGDGKTLVPEIFGGAEDPSRIVFSEVHTGYFSLTRIMSAYISARSGSSTTGPCSSARGSSSRS